MNGMGADKTGERATSQTLKAQLAQWVKRRSGERMGRLLTR